MRGERKQVTEMDGEGNVEKNKLCSNALCKKVKVKFSHTRYRALGPELIPVYRQSARSASEADSTHLIPALLLIYRPRKDERLSWPSWLTCSGWFTHISGHPSAAGRAQDNKKFASQRPTFYHCARPPTLRCVR